MKLYQQAIIFVFSTGLLACGGDDSGQSSEATGGADESTDSFGICRMLTKEQVATVLGDHDGGEVVHSGGSMMAGVDSYQCSYTANVDGQYDVLTVVVSVASTSDLLNKIKPSGFLYGPDDQLAIANGAYVNDKLDGELDITVIKGLNKIDIGLISEDAHSRKQAMTELASAVAAKL